MKNKKEFNFTSQTLKFSIAGLLIPGFTVMLILGLQMAIVFVGVECANAWVILWILTALGAVAAPIIFVRILNRSLIKGYHLTAKEIIIFNILEYTLIQAVLAMFFTNSKTLCYVTDGQNGLELVFTGWMAIPCLIILSMKFDSLKDEKIEELRREKTVN